jgi:hypothetical protein
VSEAGDSAVFEGWVPVPLGRSGRYTIVDLSDWGRVLQFRWHVSAQGYAVRRGKGERGVSLHRFLLDAPPGVEVDHRNGDSLDNRRTNLRLCSHAQNMANQRHRSGGTSRFRGVTRGRRHGRWFARIKVNYRGIHLGTFDDEREAAKAYDAAARLHFGEFARLNFPEASP